MGNLGNAISASTTKVFIVNENVDLIEDLIVCLWSARVSSTMDSQQCSIHPSKPSTSNQTILQHFHNNEEDIEAKITKI